MTAEGPGERPFACSARAGRIVERQRAGEALRRSLFASFTTFQRAITPITDSVAVPAHTEIPFPLEESTSFPPNQLMLRSEIVESPTYPGVSDRRDLSSKRVPAGNA